jgi:hypothetical protein
MLDAARTIGNAVPSARRGRANGLSCDAFGKRGRPRFKRRQWAPDEAVRNRILAANPAKLYGFS